MAAAVRLQVSTVMILLLLSCPGGTALDMLTLHPPACTALKGLTDCRILERAPLRPDQAMVVRSVELKAVLCCTDRQDCEPCLQILITIQGGEEEELPEISGQQLDEAESSGSKQLLDDSGTHLNLCVTCPGLFDYCMAVQFTPTRTVQGHQTTPEQIQLSVIEKVPFGSSPVLVKVQARNTTTRTIDMPSLEDVCSLNLDGSVKQCDVPRLRAVTDHQRGVVLLQLEVDTIIEDVMCLMEWNGKAGRPIPWHKDQKEVIIPANSVAPCLCFLVWWKGRDIRKKSCPFENQQDVYERMHRNVTISMEESPSRSDGRVLSWEVTAPCKLEAELWLCRRDSPWRCVEVIGSRQALHNYSSHAGRPMPDGRRLFQVRGEFINMRSSPSLCLKIQIKGMNSALEPHCPFATPRWRWSVPLLLGLFIISITIIGAYLTQGLLKGYFWGLLKGDNAKVGGGHVVLLYPPDDNNQALPALTGRLGSSLHTLGFSVSLDMWSKSELSVLGPVPWLHSRLDQIQRQGGKVVLVLTQAAWVKAVEWGKWGWDRDLARGVGGVPAPCSDVFSATFSCILADYLQGRAGERFVLVQFEALPSQPAGCSLPLPELFRGLQLFSLPSQSLAFLTELDVGPGRWGNAAARRKRAGGLRVASRALARGLRGLAAGPTVLRLTALSQDCVGVGAQESLETAPLQPPLTPPPRGPDSCSRVNAVDWV